MSQFINQYFDFDFMAKHFDQVLSGFGTTMLLWVVSGVFALIWGLVLSLLRQTPGRAGFLIRIPTIGYIDAFRGIPLLMVVVLIYGGFGALSSSNATPGTNPRVDRRPDVVRQAVSVLVRRNGARDHLRRLHGGGLPGRDRGGAQAVRPRRHGRSG